MGFWVWGVGCGVWGVGCGVWGLRFRVPGFGVRVQDLACTLAKEAFRVNNWLASCAHQGCVMALTYRQQFYFDVMSGALEG